MEEKIVDARGKPCPEPLIMTRQALKSLQKGQTMRVLVDNGTSKANVERYLSVNGIQPICTSADGCFALHINKTPDAAAVVDTAGYCSPKPTSSQGYAIAIGSDKMGSGPEDLGGILLKAFISTIKEVQPLPSKIVFYNSGILLAAEGSPLVSSLKELEDAGVAILVCGTCVNYFKKQELIRVGTVSNMYAILEALSGAGTVIRP